MSKSNKAPIAPTWAPKIPIQIKHPKRPANKRAGCPNSLAKISPAEIQPLKAPILGAIKTATKIIIKEKPHNAVAGPIPLLKTVSAFPNEKPPPIKEADNVANKKVAE